MEFFIEYLDENGEWIELNLATVNISLNRESDGSYSLVTELYSKEGVQKLTEKEVEEDE